MIISMFRIPLVIAFCAGLSPIVAAGQAPASFRHEQSRFSAEDQFVQTPVQIPPDAWQFCRPTLG
jgi:hypothetical protein